MNAVPPNAVPPTALPPAAVPPTAAFPSAGPSQSEFPADPQVVGPVAPFGDWRAAYLKERKKSRILGMTTAAAAVLALVFGVWGIVQMTSTSNTVAGAFGTQGQADGYFGGPGVAGPGALGGQGMAPPDGAVRGGLLEQMLNADGTIDQSAVDQFATQMAAGNGPPAALLADMAAREVANGDLTQAQADQILAALGINGTSGSTSGTAPGAASSTTTTT